MIPTAPRIRALLLVLALSCAGCINYEQKTTLEDDGSGEMEIHYWTKESAVTWLGGNAFKFDEQEIEKQYEGSNAVVRSARVETNAADSTRHVRVHVAFDDINKLSGTQAFNDARFSFETKGDSMFFRQSHAGNSSAGGLGLDQFTVTYRYEMPGRVVSSNATRVEGNTLVWKYKLSDLSNDVQLSAVMVREGGSFLTTLLILALVVLAAASVFYFLRKGKAKPSAA